MKKVLSLVTIMIILLIMLTGCVNVNYEVTLNKDGTADIAYVYGFQKEFLEQMETTAEDMTSDMKESAEASEYEIETYSDDEVEGFKAKKHVENLSDISLEETFGSENVTDSEENQFKVEKKGLKTVYSQNAKIDLSNMDETTTSVITMKYTVNLPVKVGKNNASEVSEDGRKLTWNLTAGEVNEINFEASSSNPILISAIIAILIVIVVIVVTLAIKRSKKNKEKTVEIETKEQNNEKVSEEKQEEINPNENEEK